MSYTLFLLLNVNHYKEEIVELLGSRLEQTGPDSFCLDQSPDVFFSVDYLAEENDRSLCIDIPFGAEEAVLREVLNFTEFVEGKLQVQVLDPQIGKVLKSAEAGQIIDKWKALNLQALETFSDGHHFLRNIEERNGKKVMIEAIRFQEETWQNYCSVALAYNRVGHAAEARRLFEKALELDPGNSGVLYALGVTFFNLKNYQKAKDALSESIQLEPDNPGALELIQTCDEKLK